MACTAPDVDSIADLDLTDPPVSFFPEPDRVWQPDRDTLRTTVTSSAGDEDVTFTRDTTGHVLIHIPTPHGPSAWPVHDPAQFGEWGPDWVTNFYNPDYTPSH